MDFTEEKAKEIVERYGLSEKTIKVWKTRGRIPDRYLNPNFKLRDKTKKTKLDKLKEERILRVLVSKKINQSALEQLCALNSGFISDVRKNKSSLTVEQIVLVTKELKKAMIEVKELISKKRYKKLLQYPLFFAKHVLDVSNTDYRRIMSLSTGEVKELDEDDYETIKDRYFVLTLELSKL